MSALKRGALGLLMALVVAGLVVGVLSSGSPGSDQRAGSSAADAGPQGLLGFARLLESAGHEVERIEAAPGEAELDPDSTAVLIDPGRLLATDALALRRFVDDGGRLVLGGDLAGSELEQLAGEGFGGTGAAVPPALRPLVPAPELAGVVEVVGDGSPTVADAGPMLPLLGAPGGYATLVSSPGDGRLLIVADAAPLRNRLIREADNVAFAVGLGGAAERPVAFLERVTAEPPSGLAALPERWWWTFAGLLAAGLALVAARGRRLGPPEAASRQLAPPRRRYTDAIATSLARAGDPGRATAPLRAAARDRLARRAGLGAAAGPEELRKAAAGLGLEPAEAEAIVSPASSDREAVLVGRALAKLTPTTTTEARR